MKLTIWNDFINEVGYQAIQNIFYNLTLLACGVKIQDYNGNFSDFYFPGFNTRFALLKSLRFLITKLASYSSGSYLTTTRYTRLYLNHHDVNSATLLQW